MVPDLDFAEAAGRTAGHGEAFAVGGEGEGVDAFRDADEPRHELEILRGIEQHFVVASDGEELAFESKATEVMTGEAAYFGGFMASTGTVLAEAGVSSVAP